MSEARIVINGFMLTDAQATVVRVAVTSLRSELQDPASRDALGAIAGAYDDRLREVEMLIFEEAGS